MAVILILFLWRSSLRKALRLYPECEAAVSVCQWKALFRVPKQRQRSEHISGCKCHVAAEWWMSGAFDVWERSEHNSQSAVTPSQARMIHSIHTGSAPFAHIYQGAVVLCESIICAQFFPSDEGGASHNMWVGFISPWSALEAMKTRLSRLWTLLWVY